MAVACAVCEEPFGPGAASRSPRVRARRSWGTPVGADGAAQGLLALVRCVASGSRRVRDLRHDLLPRSGGSELGVTSMDFRKFENRGEKIMIFGSKFGSIFLEKS